MAFAQVRADGTLFQVRVGGVAVHDGRVLLHRFPEEDFWAFPGGRLQIGETAAECLAREMAEEIDTAVDVGDLLWVVENYFEHPPLDQHDFQAGHMQHHELGLYLAMTLPEELVTSESFIGREAVGTPDEFEMEFRWFELGAVVGLDIKPKILEELVNGPLDEMRAVVNRG